MGAGLTYDVGKLGLSNQVPRLGAHELLLELHELGALGLLVLELLDLVGDLGFGVAAGLHAALGVADLLEQGAVVLKVLRHELLLLAQLRQQDAELVADVRQRLVARRLAPIGQLRGDGDALAARRLNGPDRVVLRLDELEKLLGQFGLLDTPQRGHGEAVTRGILGAGRLALLGADGECAIPNLKSVR